jgi:NTE family protein
MNKRANIPEKEKAFVLQGGGSLGAYGAGVYSGLYESLSKMDIEEGNKGKPIFDIIAGTSIGAINAAVLVSYVVENQTYEGSAERLVDFWNYLSKESKVETNPFFRPLWNYWHTIDRKLHREKLQGDIILLERVCNIWSTKCLLSSWTYI